MITRCLSATRPTRLFVALALAVLATGAALGPSTPAVAQVPPVTGRACAPGEGVTVVVDFNGLAGGIKLGCAAGSQATGFAALAAAGFAIDSGSAANVVCTVDGVPAEGYPFCWTGGGFWSYWKASRGGSWALSPVGAGAGPIATDRVEGWSWAPSFASQAPRADETSGPVATTTTTTSGPVSTTSTAPDPTTTTTDVAADPGSAPGTYAPSTTPRPTGSTPASTLGAGPSPTLAPGAAGRDDVVVKGAAASPTRSGDTTLARTGADLEVPVLVGGSLLGLGIVAIALGRRRSSPARR